MNPHALFRTFLSSLLICSVILLLIYASGFLTNLVSSLCLHSELAGTYAEDIWLGNRAMGTYMNFFIFFTISFLANAGFVRKQK